MRNIAWKEYCIKPNAVVLKVFSSDYHNNMKCQIVAGIRLRISYWNVPESERWMRMTDWMSWVKGWIALYQPLSDASLSDLPLVDNNDTNLYTGFDTWACTAVISMCPDNCWMKRASIRRNYSTIVLCDVEILHTNRVIITHNKYLESILNKKYLCSIT